MNKKALIGYSIFAAVVIAVVIYLVSIPKSTGSDQKNSLELTISKDRTSYAVTGIGTYKKSDVVIPAEFSGLPVTEIANGAFRNCKDITSVVIPDSVTSIGKNAFYDCKNLAEATVSGSVKSIGESAFSGCSDLKTVTLSDGLETIDSYAFSRCSSLESIVIPDSVTSLGSWAFNECNSLTSAKLPKNLDIINQRTFWMCSKLTDVEIPDGVTEIGEYAFSMCNLKDIIIPSSVEVIGDGAFSGCFDLESITLSYGVKKIGYVAFDINSGIFEPMVKELIIPDSVEELEERSFGGLAITSAVIPKSVTNIDGSPFGGCRNLVDLTIENGNERYYSVNNCIIERGTGTLVATCEGSVLPDDGSIRIIGCASLSNLYLETLTVPDGVVEIAKNALSNCPDLKEIILPKSVEKIGMWALSGNSLEKIIYQGTAEEWEAIEKDDKWLPFTAEEFELIFEE